MPKVFYRQPDGTEKIIDGQAGDSVMALAVRHGVTGIVGQCGGQLSCATCHVFVESSDLDHFDEVDELEDEMLDCAATDREPNSRLSCQLVLHEHIDLHVVVPESQL